MEQLKNSPPEGSKKAYTRPELLIYGNLVQITSAVGTVGMHDGGVKAGKTRTR